MQSQSPRQAAVMFVFITVLLDMLALGIIIPVLPKLILNFVGENTSDASRIFGVFGTAFALMQFIFSPVMGSLSDRFGRRLVILVSNFGLGLDYVLMALAPNLTWLFAGRLLSGITSASIPAAYAYIGDVTPHEKRASAFGMVGAAFGVGFVVGPALGGLLGTLDERLPFWFAATLSLANGFYGLFVLPESLGKDKRTPFRFKAANPLGALRLLRSHRSLMGMAFVGFVCSLAHEVLPSVYVLYTHYRYQWEEGMVGLTLALVGVTSGVVQGVLVGPAVKKFGESVMLVAGMLLGVAGFLSYGLSEDQYWFLLGNPLVALWGFAGASMQSIMSKLVGAHEQGQLQGANNSIRGMASLIGPGLYTVLFAHFIDPNTSLHLPGAPFLLSAALVGVGTLVSLRYLRS